MKTEALVLKDQGFTNWHRAVSGRWSIEDLRRDDSYRESWISFDCLAWDAERHAMFLGLTAISGDIFWKFDTHTSEFSSLDFGRVGDRFDAKFHRSLTRDADGSYLVATAMLHDMDQQHHAKGGKLVRYRPDLDSYEVLSVPVPPHYIQSIVLDTTRRRVYGFTYPGEYLFMYDLEAGIVQKLAYVGNGRMICQPHCAVLDQDGCLWGTWGENRAFEDEQGPMPIRLFRYDPRTDTFDWYPYGPPTSGSHDSGRVDHMLLASDGMIYIGGVSGALTRLDPSNGEVQSLGKPFAGSRLAGLVQARDGYIYGAGNEGMDRDGEGAARMFRYDTANGTTEDLGRIYDASRQAGAIKVHMLAEGEDGVLYAGENDNLWRSSYLWRCHV
jgi:hypothetical protein